MSGLDAILGKRQPLPFGKRMDHLGSFVAKGFHGERHGTLNTVEVVVDAHAAEHKQRCSDTSQTKLGAEILLEEVFYKFYALLCAASINSSAIAGRYNNVAHIKKVLLTIHYPASDIQQRVFDCKITFSSPYRQLIHYFFCINNENRRKIWSLRLYFLFLWMTKDTR